MNSRRHSYLIMLGHACTDINQGALPALLPYFVIAYDLSYTLAAVIVLANSLVSAIIQPLFGFLGDRIDRPWFMSLGILLAASGIAAMGFFTSYAAIVACALVTGIGVALFHPEGGKLANIVAGEKKGAGISNFSVGGNIGFGIGPIIAVFAISQWGMHGTAAFLIPAAIMAPILFFQTRAYRRLTDVEHQRIRSTNEEAQKDDWVGFSKITFVNTCRSVIGAAYMTFIPLYWISVLGQTQDFAVLMLTVYSLGGAIATFFGGRLADRFGFKRTVLLSVSILAPLSLIFVITTNVVIATILILLCSLVHAIGHAPMVALGQSYLPNRIGFASGISLGVVVSIGGIVAPGIGRVGDLWGLSMSMWVVCAIAFLAIGMCLTLFMGRNAREKGR
jgi:FSR family fosmidomycin resistance protein-like MFS transporter